MHVCENPKINFSFQNLNMITDLLLSIIAHYPIAEAQLFRSHEKLFYMEPLKQAFFLWILVAFLGTRY
jgi:hypothetical protein